MSRLLRLAAVAASLLAAMPAADRPSCPGTTTADQVLDGVDFNGKVAIVTGGDSGLGFAIATSLAKRGATIVIGGRNTTAGDIAARNITLTTGAKVVSMKLDLGSLASVREFAAGFLSAFGPTLHLLLNNAGIGGPSVLTKDGFELVFEVDYLGHFLLTELLLPALRTSSPARIINTASGSHADACADAGWPVNCFKDWTYLPPPVVDNASSYGVAKFLNIQHAAALARREARFGVQAFSLTPGFAWTSMTDHFDPSQYKATCEAQEHVDPSIPTNPCPFTPEQGAASIAFCASGRALHSGAYYSRPWACEERPTATHGFTPEMQLELYERSLKWAGLAGGSVSVNAYV